MESEKESNSLGLTSDKSGDTNDEEKKSVEMKKLSKKVSGTGLKSSDENTEEFAFHEEEEPSCKDNFLEILDWPFKKIRKVSILPCNNEEVFEK